MAIAKHLLDFVHSRCFYLLMAELDPTASAYDMFPFKDERKATITPEEQAYRTWIAKAANLFCDLYITRQSPTSDQTRHDRLVEELRVLLIYDQHSHFKVTPMLPKPTASNETVDWRNLPYYRRPGKAASI